MEAKPYQDPLAQEQYCAIGSPRFCSWTSGDRRLWRWLGVWLGDWRFRSDWCLRDESQWNPLQRLLDRYIL